jgi:hypothetical protein
MHLAKRNAFGQYHRTDVPEKFQWIALHLECTAKQGMDV